MPQRITILIPGLGGGGTERIVARIANSLLKYSDYEVDVICLGYPEGPALYDLDRRATLVPLNVENSWQDGSMGVFLTSLRESFPLLLQYFRKRKPLVVLTNWFNSPLLWLRERYALDFKVIIIEHMNFKTWQRHLRGNLGAEVMHRTCRYFYKKADAIIGVSRGVSDELIALGIAPPDKTYCIYNPVVNSEILLQARDEIDHPWFKEQRPVILAAGRLMPEKDYITLLKAFHTLSLKTDVRLIILGEGKERERLERLGKELGIANKIDIHGYVSNPYAYMSRAQVFVLSSIHEALPTVLIEALACGVTPVSTKCPYGPEEILDGGRLGYLVPVGNVQALAEGMFHAINEPLPSKLLRARAMQFSDRAAFEAYDALIKSLL